MDDTIEGTIRRPTPQEALQTQMKRIAETREKTEKELERITRLKEKAETEVDRLATLQASAECCSRLADMNLSPHVNRTMRPKKDAFGLTKKERGDMATILCEGLKFDKRKAYAIAFSELQDIGASFEVFGNAVVNARDAMSDESLFRMYSSLDDRIQSVIKLFKLAYHHRKPKARGKKARPLQSPG